MDTLRWKIFDSKSDAPADVLHRLHNQSQRFPHMMSQIWLQQREDKVPLSAASGLDTVGVTLSHGIQQCLVTAEDGLNAKLGRQAFCSSQMLRKWKLD